MSDDLIKRLELAQGPDRELDAAIYAMCGEPPEHLRRLSNLKMWAEGRVVLWRGGTVTQGHVFERRATYPHYTASIDAALTLVPEGYCWSRFPGRVEIIKEEHYGDPFVQPYSSKAQWIAIALCIAALRARAAIAAKTETASGN